MAAGGGTLVSYYKPPPAPAAKAAKDYAASDRIRDQLAQLGITLMDTKDGTTWERAQ